MNLVAEVGGSVHLLAMSLGLKTDRKQRSVICKPAS
jgi:hypothetical protein